MVCLGVVNINRSCQDTLGGVPGVVNINRSCQDTLGGVPGGGKHKQIMSGHSRRCDWGW